MIRLEPGDVLLLCSDGLWGYVDPERLTDALLTNPNPQGAAAKLVDEAMVLGSIDNITALVVAVDEQAPPKVEWTDDFDALET